jgi:hypothetical protein
LIPGPALVGRLRAEEEMSRPLEGLMQISGAPARNALGHLGQ